VRHPIAPVFILAAATLPVAAIGVGFDAAEPGAEVTYLISELALPTPAGTHSRGSSINDGGVVAGYYNRSGDQAREAIVWLHGQPHPLGTLGGTNSSVTWPGKTKRSLVVGIAQTGIVQPRGEAWSCSAFFPGPDAATYTCLGFAWDTATGEMRELPTLGGDNGYAASANNRRQVVGWAENLVLDPENCVLPQRLQFRPVLWDLDTKEMRELPLYPGDSSGAATGINDRGQVVGISGICDQAVGRHTARHAVLWENGTVRDLGNVGGDTWNTPTSITQRGDIVVGFASSPGDDPDNPGFRAWLWTERDDVCLKLPGTDICDLGTLDVGGTAQAWGVNERGQVVGTACAPSGECKAFLWEKGVMTDLNHSKRGYVHHLENALDINNLGEMTGRALTSTNERLAFVAIPTRQP
jgi:probable HAF family extracellular repeat protein